MALEPETSFLDRSGSLKPVHDLQHMRAQTVPLLHVPCKRHCTFTRTEKPCPGQHVDRAWTHTLAVSQGDKVLNYTTRPAVLAVVYNTQNVRTVQQSALSEGKHCRLQKCRKCRFINQCSVYLRWTVG